MDSLRLTTRGLDRRRRAGKRPEAMPCNKRWYKRAYADLQARLPPLKFWVSSGEALPLELWQRFRERLPQSRLLNLYGSSDVAADITCYATTEGAPRTCVPIGRPIANTQVYLLDRHRLPVPLGVPGELCSCPGVLG